MANGILAIERILGRRRGGPKIDRSMPIVAEPRQVTDRRNSSLKSRARISGGSWTRFFCCGWIFASTDQDVTVSQNERGGV